jgi:hypothetical protein
VSSPVADLPSRRAGAAPDSAAAEAADIAAPAGAGVAPAAAVAAAEGPHVAAAVAKAPDILAGVGRDPGIVAVPPGLALPGGSEAAAVARAVLAPQVPLPLAGIVN